MTEPHSFHDKHNTKNVVWRDQMSASERHGVSVNKGPLPMYEKCRLREHVHTGGGGAKFLQQRLSIFKPQQQ